MTSCSQLEELDAMVMGELDASEARTLRAHTDTCAACAMELAMLVEERALFARRARALDALDPPRPMAASVRATPVVLPANDYESEPRRMLPALGRIAMRGHFTAACAAALFVVAALSRLGTATVSMSMNDDVASIATHDDEAVSVTGMLASYRSGEPLACSLAGFGGSSGTGSAGAASTAIMREDGAMTSSSSGASRGELLACTPDIATAGAMCEPSVTCSVQRQ